MLSSIFLMSSLKNSGKGEAFVSYSKEMRPLIASAKAMLMYKKEKN
jgi:hypothetical protein